MRAVKRQFHEIANIDINFIPESESDILLTAFVQYTVVLLPHEQDKGTDENALLENDTRQ